MNPAISTTAQTAQSGPRTAPRTTPATAGATQRAPSQPRAQDDGSHKRPEAPLPPHTEISQAAFLQTYRRALVEEVARSAPPLYHGPSSAPTARLSLLRRKPLGAQALAILAGACGIRGRRATHTDPGQRRSPGLGLVMEMGTGKTFTSLSILAMADEEIVRVAVPPEQRAEKRVFFPAVVLCPPILQEKWAREAEQTLPNARVVILRPITTRTEAATFRRFDPTFHGRTLSAVGVAERIARRIRSELELWRNACVRARTAGKRQPAKPCHVVVVSQSTAKFGMPWAPIYVLRALREMTEEGKVRLQRDSETGDPVVVPCCPTCFTPIAEDERHARARERRHKKHGPRELDQEGGGAARGAVRGTASTTDAASGGNAASAGVGEAAVGMGVLEGDDDGDGGDLGGSAADLPYLAEADVLGIGCPRVKRRCAACHGALWQTLPEGMASWTATPPPLDGNVLPRAPLPLPSTRSHHPQQTVKVVTSTANRRYPIADYLRRRHRGLFRALIADEAHQLKGAGTAQGFAAASLVDACAPQGTVIFLTGTLAGGYASDLFPMLWRLMPSLRTRFGYDEVARWVGLYGVRQKTITLDVTPGGYGGVRSKRKENPPRFKELPGISPLVLNLLLPHCLFLELADVAPDLPPYSEDMVTVPLGPELEPVYNAFQREATDALKAQLRAGDNSGTSSWFHGLMIWPSLPCDEIVARCRRTGVVLGRAPALSADAVYPKERALLDLVRRERAEGRRVLIYAEHTGEHDLLPRLSRLLEEDDARWRVEDPQDHPSHPVRVVILRGETVAAADREAWLNRQVAQGCDVVVCHSGLVEVGLDLLAFPTILVYEVIFSTTRWRQAIRRSWRPGQTLPVRVIQLAYEKTMEARGLQLIATKAISSLMVEGKMPSQSLSAQAQTNATTNLIMELFEQVVADQEDGQQSIIVASVQNTFIELNRVEQEADTYIGEVELDLPEFDDEDALEMEVEVEETAEHGTGTLFGLPLIGGASQQRDRATSELPAVTPTPLVSDDLLVAAPLFAEEGVSTVSLPADDDAAAVRPAADGPCPVSIPAGTLTAKPVALPPPPSSGERATQHRYTWEEMRARLQAEATQRKAARSKRAAGSRAAGSSLASDHGPGAARMPLGSLWEHVEGPTEPSAARETAIPTPVVTNSAEVTGPAADRTPGDNDTGEDTGGQALQDHHAPRLPESHGASGEVSEGDARDNGVADEDAAGSAVGHQLHLFG